MTTDIHWESWGAKDPYYGVLTHPRFRAAALTPEAREEFFLSGRVHVEYVLSTCRQQLDEQFAPRRILDFGCGVGRLAIPFAVVAKEVIGLDVSPSMLAEARRNCEERGANNVWLALSDDTLSAADGQFDLVHSCIVLQHIEVPRGRELFARLVERIRPGGIAALHVAFAWDLYAESFGQPLKPQPPPPTGPMGRLKAWLREHRREQPAEPREVNGDPEMQMNFYNLSELLFIVQRSGSARVFIELTNHGGAYGAFLFFRRPAP